MRWTWGRDEPLESPATCGKKRYPSKRLAQEVFNRSQRNNRRPTRIYQCPDCAGWHMTFRHAGRDYGYKQLGGFKAQRIGPPGKRWAQAFKVKKHENIMRKLRENGEA
jgi:hypothetical protein